MFVLIKGNVQKIVSSQDEAFKLTLKGFKPAADTKIMSEDKSQADFKCHICSKEYKTQENLNAHIFKKHTDKGGEINGADTCGADTDSSKNGAEAE